jgi:methylamine---glutamate N-methyltransferase subunit C
VPAVAVAQWDDLTENQPAYALVENVDLVVIRLPEDEVRVMYGRCQHRGALLSDGGVRNDRLVCGLHGSTYDVCTGKNVHYPGADLRRFDAWVEDGQVYVDADAVKAWETDHPQKYRRDSYQGLYADFKGTEEEPHNGAIQALAGHGLSRVGHHGQVAAMGVPAPRLPKWDDLQFVTAQLARPPLLDDAPVATGVVLGPRAQKPLHLDIPLLVSDMSYGALSEEAKTAMARGAERAGTAICSGEGGVLPEEQAENSRYGYKKENSEQPVDRIHPSRQIGVK